MSAGFTGRTDEPGECAAWPGPARSAPLRGAVTKSLVTPGRLTRSLLDFA
jgi:hypothetical protein